MRDVGDIAADSLGSKEQLPAPPVCALDDDTSCAPATRSSAVGAMFGPNRRRKHSKPTSSSESSSTSSSHGSPSWNAEGVDTSRASPWFFHNVFRRLVMEREFLVFHCMHRNPPLVFCALATMITIAGIVLFSPETQTVMMRATNSVCSGMYGLLTVSMWYSMKKDSTSSNDVVVDDEEDPFILSPTSRVRERIRRDAAHHEVLRIVTHLVSFLFGFGNISGNCQTRDVSEHSRMCNNSIQSDALILLPLLPVVFLAPLRTRVLLPLYTVALALYFGIPAIPGLKYGPQDDTHFTADVILITAEVVVCVIVCMVREERVRANFCLHIRRHVRGRSIKKIQQQVEEITALQLPVDVLRLKQSEERRREEEAASNPTSPVLSINHLSTMPFVFHRESATVVSVATSGFGSWCAKRSPADAVYVQQRLVDVYEDVLQMFTEFQSRTHFFPSSDPHNTRTCPQQDFTAPPPPTTTVNLQRVHAFGDLYMLIMTVDRNTRHGHGGSGTGRGSSTGASDQRVFDLYSVSASLGVELLQSICRVLPKSLAELFWCDQDDVERHRLKPLCTVVEGSAGYGLHPTTHNIVGVGYAVEQSLLLVQQTEQQVMSLERKKHAEEDYIGAMIVSLPSAWFVACDLLWMKQGLVQRPGVNVSGVIDTEFEVPNAMVVSLDQLSSPFSEWCAKEKRTLSQPQPLITHSTNPLEFASGEWSEHRVVDNDSAPPPPPPPCDSKIRLHLHHFSLPVRQSEEDDEHQTQSVCNSYVRGGTDKSETQSPRSSSDKSELTSQSVLPNQWKRQSQSHGSGARSSSPKRLVVIPKPAVVSSGQEADDYQENVNLGGLMDDDRLTQLPPHTEHTVVSGRPEPQVGKYVRSAVTRVDLISTWCGIVLHFDDPVTEEMFLSAQGVSRSDALLHTFGNGMSFAALFAISLLTRATEAANVSTFRQPTLYSGIGLGLTILIASVPHVYQFLKRRVGLSSEEGRVIGRSDLPLLHVHTAEILCSQGLYMTTLFMGQPGSLIYRTQLMWIFIMLHWSIYRPLHASQGVMLLHDAAVAGVFLYRIFASKDIATGTTDGGVNKMAVLCALVALLAIAVIRWLRERSRREFFAVEMLLHFQQEEMEEDYRRLTEALEEMVPAGVAGAFVRTVRREQRWHNLRQSRGERNPLGDSESTPKNNQQQCDDHNIAETTGVHQYSTGQDSYRRRCVSHPHSNLQVRQWRGSIYGTSRSMRAIDVPFCFLELEKTSGRSGETLKPTTRSTSSTSARWLTTLPSPIHVADCVILWKMVESVESCIPHALKSQIVVAQSSHNAVLLVALPMNDMDDDRDEERADNLAVVSHVVFKHLIAMCSTYQAAKIRPKMILDVGPSVGAVLGHHAVHFKYFSGQMHRAASAMALLDPMTVAVSDRFHALLTLNNTCRQPSSEMELNNINNTQYIKQVMRRDRDEAGDTGKVTAAGYSPLLFYFIHDTHRFSF